jgi:hypothetical protein
MKFLWRHNKSKQRSPEFKPMQQLERTLCEIAERCGAARREWVMMEMEYAGGNICDAR